MLGTLKKPLFAFGMIAMAASFCLAPSLTTSATADGDEAIKTFKKQWKKNKKQIDAETRRGLAQSLPGDNADAVKYLEEVLEDEFWSVRWPAVVSIANSKSPEVIAQWVELLRNKRTKDGVKKSIAYALVRSSSENRWDLSRELLQDDSLIWDVRETFARKMSEWPIKQMPRLISVNDNEAETKKIEEYNEKIQATVQPILKANLMALYEVLKVIVDPKFAKKVKSKEKADYRKFRWSTVYAMETISSQEWGEDLKAWDIFLTQTHIDKESGELKPLEFKFPKRVDTKVGNVKISGETAVRKKKRRDTNTELVMIPQQGYDIHYFGPFMQEFTHYFDVSSFKMPRAEEGQPNYKDARGNEDPNAFLYPTAEVAKAFDTYRKKQGGDKSLGMFLHGSSCFIGMEFAKNNPKKAAFIIVVGGWSTNAEVSDGIEACRRHQDLDHKYYGVINRTYYGNGRTPEEFTSAKRFLGNTGDIAHQFSDRWDPDQYLVRQIGRDQNPEPGRRSSLIDQEYAFTARPASKVPALFIWGEDDPMYIKGSEKNLKKYFKNLMTVEMKGVSRLPWLEDPMGFFDHIEKFMKDKKVWERMDELKSKKN